MPAWVKDHDIWEKAKAQAKKEYADLEEGDRFWSIVTAIYKKMGGTIGTAKARLVFGKAQAVSTVPHEDAQVAADPGSRSQDVFIQTILDLQRAMHATPLVSEKLALLEEGIDLFAEMIEDAQAHQTLSPDSVEFYQRTMDALQAQHDELSQRYPTVKPQQRERGEAETAPSKAKRHPAKATRKLSLFKRVGRGIRLFFKSQDALHTVPVQVGGHYRTKPSGDTEYVRPHQATRRKRVPEVKPEPLTPIPESGPSWRPAGRPDVIATGQYGGSVYEFAVAPHEPHGNFHIVARVKGWGDWEPAYAGVGDTYDEAVRAFVKRHWNQDEVEFHDPVAHAHDAQLWADHRHRVETEEAERKQRAEADERRQQHAQKLHEHLRQHVRFTKQRMQIATDDQKDPITVEGHAWHGLLVHRPMGYDKTTPHGPKGWVVSHQQSGRRIAHYATSMEAKIAAMRLAPLQDWHHDADAILAHSHHPDHAATLEQIKRLVEDPYAELATKSLSGHLSQFFHRLLAKAHVKTYTRSDGTLVQEHDDRRRSAQPEQPGDKRRASQRPLLNWKRQGKPKATEPKAPSMTFDATAAPEPGRIEEWLHRVNQEPDIQQAMREVLEGTPTAHLYKQEDGSYGPERAKLHQAIVSSMLNPRAVAEDGQRPQACILLGAPASGKTTALQPAARELGVEFTVINADDVKDKLPEYNGRNAGLVHTESSDIAEGQLLPQALQANHHVLLDITGGNDQKVKAMVDAFHKAGYDISIMYVHLPIEKTAARAVARFRKSGRFVPPDYIVNKVDGNPEDTYNQLKDDPRVSHWRRYSSDVDTHQRAVRQEHGRRPTSPTDRATVAKSVRGGESLAGVRGYGGVSERHHSQEPGGLHQHPEVDALIAKAQTVRASMLKSLATLDQDLLSPDLDPPMRGTLLAERLKMLERLEALNEKQAQMLAVVGT